VKRIPSLDGLRAISIALVILGHMAKSYHAPRIFWDVYAALGVRIFFVISGYLITTLLISEQQRTTTIRLKEFYIRRAYRIFPAALVFILFAFIFYWHEMRWYNIAAALLYLSTYDLHRPWILGHLWSLSIEEQFYLLWPGVLKRWYKHRVAILLGVMVGAPLCRILFYYWRLPGGENAFPCLADSLAIGALVAALAPRLPVVGPKLAMGMAVAVFVLPLFNANTVGRTLLLSFVLNPLLLISIAAILWHVVHTPYGVLNFKPVVWLGRISYSLYLRQQPFCSDPHLRSGRLVLLALGAACLSYYFIEQPMLRIREKASGRRSVRKEYQVNISGLLAAEPTPVNAGD
jgi:peptidoglycan/LPS O-acetylase OafA/YrhL